MRSFELWIYILKTALWTVGLEVLRASCTVYFIEETHRSRQLEWYLSIAARLIARCHVLVFFVCRRMEINYLTFRFWIGMWMCLMLLLMVAFDLSALVRYITRFTEESFAMLIAVIFIYEAFKKLIHILRKAPVDLYPLIPQDFNCSCLPPNSSSPEPLFLSSTLSSNITGDCFVNTTCICDFLNHACGISECFEI